MTDEADPRPPCSWWWRWFCRAPHQPIHHSWQCLICRRITLD